MWCLVMAHEKEWFGFVAPLHKLDTLICDDVRGIARTYNRSILANVNHRRIEVVPLAGKDGPVVKTSRLMVATFAEMPLPNHSCLVTTSSKMLCDIWNVLVDFAVQCDDSVDMVVCSCEDACSTRCTDGICDIAMIKTHSFITDTVQVWR